LSDYEKLLSVNLKEQRVLNNDKVKNIKTLEEENNQGETNIVELFTQINELFRNKKELEERERQEGQLLPAEEMFLKVQTELKETRIHSLTKKTLRIFYPFLFGALVA